MPEPKRRSIKFKCKSLVKKPTRRSARHTAPKNYTEEEVPDDDHYICKFNIIFIFNQDTHITLARFSGEVRFLTFGDTKYRGDSGGIPW